MREKNSRPGDGRMTPTKLEEAVARAIAWEFYSPQIPNQAAMPELVDAKWDAFLSMAQYAIAAYEKAKREEGK